MTAVELAPGDTRVPARATARRADGGPAAGRCEADRPATTSRLAGRCGDGCARLTVRRRSRAGGTRDRARATRGRGPRARRRRPRLGRPCVPRVALARVPVVPGLPDRRRAARPGGGRPGRRRGLRRGRRARRAARLGRAPAAAPAAAGRRPAAPRSRSRWTRRPVRLAIGVDIGGTKVAAGRGRRGRPACWRWSAGRPRGDVAGTEDAIAELGGRAGRPVRRGRGRHRRGRLDRQRPGHRAVLAAPGLAGRAAAGRAGRPDRAAGHGGERRQRGRLGRVPVRRRARRAGGLHASRSAPGSAAAWSCPARSTAARTGWRASGATWQVVPDGRRCACGNRGCWEMYASGTALARDARELAEVSPVAAHRLLELAGGDPAALTGT